MSSGMLMKVWDQVSDSPGAILELRSFILDLAMRGKLVPQLQDDEPASALLARIERLKASASKRTSGRQVQARSRNTGLGFAPPRGWIFTTLGEITLKITDGAHKTPTYVDKGVPFVSVKDFSGGHLDLSNTRLIPEDEHKELYKRCDPKQGDILIGRIGTLGRAVVVDTNREFSLFVSVGLIRFDAQCIVPAFLKALLNSPIAEREFDRIKIGGGTHTNKLNLGDLHTVAVPLPPFAEQQRIVAKVDELMALCDQLEKARANREVRRDKLTTATLARLNTSSSETLRTDARFALDNFQTLTTRSDQIKQLREAVSRLAVQGRLSEQRASDEPASILLAQTRSAKDALGLPRLESELRNENMPFNLPAGWVWTNIGEISSKTGSGSTPRGGKSAYKKSGVPFLRSQNIYNDELRLEDVAFIDQQTHKRMAGTAVSPRDLLLNITGGSMGRCCHVPDEFGEANVSQHVAIIRCAVPAVSDFLHTLILSPYFQAFIFDEQTGAGRGGLPKNRMDRIAVALPPLQEQQRIVAKVDELMTLCDQLEASLASSDEVRSRLLAVLLVNVLQPAKGCLPEDDKLGTRSIKLAS